MCGCVCVLSVVIVNLFLSVKADFVFFFHEFFTFMVLLFVMLKKL